MTRNVVLVCFLISFSNLFCQTPKENFTLSQNYIYLANLDLHKQNYKLATKRFKKSLQIHHANNSYDILNAAASGFKSGNKKFARKMIIKSIVEFAAPREFVLNYEKYKEYKDDEIFEEVKNNYNYYIDTYFRNLKNPTAYFEVQKLVDKDQNIRNLIIDIKQRIKVDKSAKSEIDSILYKKMDEVDSINTNALIEITKKYGFQERSWLILWHQRGQGYKDVSTNFWKFFIPIIEKEIQNGNLHESFFAQFDDEFETRSGKQMYGFYLQQLNIYPIQDIENVDKRRKQVGLPPLLYDKVIYGVTLPMEYNLSEEELYNELLGRIKN